MKIGAFAVAAAMFCCACLTAVATGTAALAQAATQSMASQLVGHWQLVSIAANGSEPYGPNPRGSLFIDGEGHFSIIVVSAGSAQDIALFGTYTVDDPDHSMLLHIDGGTRPDADGRDIKRVVTIRGDEMIADTTSSAEFPGTLNMTWKRSD